jgi:hypothetical protein
MPEDAEFGARYKKLLDKHVAPDPRRSAAALAAVLRNLSGDGPTSKPEKMEWKTTACCDTIARERKDCNETE